MLETFAADPRGDRRPPVCYRGAMHNANEGDRGTLLAGFGTARLVRFLDGRVELEGGTEADRKAALEWFTRFSPGTRLGEPKPLPWPPRK